MKRVTFSKLARKISTSPILERFSEMAWSSDRCCSEVCLLSYVTGISERKTTGWAQNAPLPPELSRTRAHPEQRASPRLAKWSGLLQECAGVASPPEIPVTAVVYSPPHAARVVYVVANAAAVGIVLDAVNERSVRVENVPWPELYLG
jgi:hypothetical protein